MERLVVAQLGPFDGREDSDPSDCDILHVLEQDNRDKDEQSNIREHRLITITEQEGDKIGQDLYGFGKNIRKAKKGLWEVINLVSLRPFILFNIFSDQPSFIIYNPTQMTSKSSALSDLQTQHSHIKLQMLESNLTRVLSQNKKLHHLLEYSDHFPKLKQHITQVTHNRQRLSSLITQINDLDLQIKTDRDAINSSVNHYYEHINKNIINQIKSQKVAVSGCEERIQEIKNRQRMMVRKSFERVKLKYVGYAKAAQCKIGEIVSEAESAFVDGFKNSIIPALVEKVESQFEFNELNCRTQLGHLQNLLSFYSKTNEWTAKNSMECQEQQEIQQQIALLRKKAQEVTRRSMDKMQFTAKQIELKLKGVSAEIAWLQNKRRRQKRMNTKQSQQPSHEEYSENPKIIELSYQADSIQYQIMGLTRYCDRLNLRKKILSSKQPQPSPQTPIISSHLQRQLLALNDRILDIHSRLKQSDSFYKSY